MTEETAAPRFERHDLGITPFWTEASEEDRLAQRRWQEELASRGDIRIAPDAVVSRLAAIYPETLRLGARSYVSAHVVMWGEIRVGEDCTINPFSELRGRVTLGDGVRVGAHTSILGFNHETGTDRPIHEQPLVVEGVEVGDDVWIGSHVVVLDGVSIGAHSIVGAGAVVTRDLPPWSVAVGNPARVIRDRREGAAPRVAPPAAAGLVERIGARAAAELPGILGRAWREPEQSFVDHEGAAPTVRAWCDAVELAVASGAGLPVDGDRVVRELRRRQDPATGLVPDWGAERAEPSPDGHAGVNYHVIAAGSALELLGSGFEHPVRAVDELGSETLRAALEAQPWRTDGWRAGAWVDATGTAMLWNRARFGRPAEAETLLGWLASRCDPASGMWSPVHPVEGRLPAVNGFYRLTRGTFAQFDVPLPHPERAIDSVLAHARDGRWFGPDRGTACNVLDVIHPLWLAARQTGHRREDGEAWAHETLERVARGWQEGRGFSFALQAGDDWQRRPGLLGTEMWLSITWLLADYLGLSESLGYRPRGVHRPEPALPLGREDAR